MQAKYAFVVPAAGNGSRFDSTLPKQYHKIDELTVIEHTLSALYPFEAEIVVAIAQDDTIFPSLELEPRVSTVVGGSTRADSVLNACRKLAKTSNPEWVLVHDAARPCIYYEDIQALLDKCLEANHGGLLVAPSIDTLKFTDGSQVQHTLDRAQVKRALTPQMFPLTALIQALEDAKQQGLTVTDEASCMEMMGHPVLTVECQSANLKITQPRDLQIAKVLIAEEFHD